MSQHSFFIPWVGPSLNKIWAGMHWSRRKRIADQGHYICKISTPKVSIGVPVALMFTPVLGKGKRGFDCSNYAVTAKVIEDGLVRAGVLKDDTGAYVHSVVLNRPIRGDETGMNVVIVEVESD